MGAPGSGSWEVEISSSRIGLWTPPDGEGQSREEGCGVTYQYRNGDLIEKAVRDDNGGRNYQLISCICSFCGYLFEATSTVRKSSPQIFAS